MLYGVDVHGVYQAGLDFALLRRQGYSFCAVKASQGTSFVGPQFAAWTAAGRAAGLIMGAYHWIEHGRVTEQVDHFLRVLATVGGPDGLLIQLDCEDSATWADLQEWDRVWRERTGGQPYLIYTGAWWWDAAGRRWDGSSITPLLWHSHYLAADTDGVPDDPAEFAARIPAAWWAPGYGGWKAATILQFSSKGDAGGLRNNVDLNATKLTREQLLALTHAPREDIVTDDSLYGLDDERRVFASNERIASTVAMEDQTKQRWLKDYDAENPTFEPNDLVLALKAIAANLTAIKTKLDAGVPPTAGGSAGLSGAELAASLRAQADQLDPPAA